MRIRENKNLGEDLELRAYVDADWVGCKETRRSTTRYIILLNSTVVSYYSKK